MRVALGWYFFYAGITKILNPGWSAGGFLANAKTFHDFYAWFAQPDILPLVDLLNEWGLTLVGAALILGIGVRLASIAGAALMVLYYFPALQFPYLGAHNYIVDEHVINTFALLYLGAVRAGRVWGLERWLAGLPVCARFPALRSPIG